MEKLTRYEKAVARKLGISAQGVRKVRVTCYGTVYDLRACPVVSVTCQGYSKPEVYRLLLRQLIARAGL